VTVVRPSGLAFAAALALASCSGDEAVQEVAAGTEAAQACQQVTFEEVPLTVCTADPALHTIRTALKPEDGPNYRGLTTFAATHPPDAAPVAFAMNAGMYDDDGNPIGYYVEGGEKRHDLSRTEGPGNFHMMPNGVFFGTGGKWEVRTSQDFFDTVDKRPEFGTQSGPMLVIGGKLHPQFDEDGESLRIRNAVGVDAKGRALFVISNREISFGKLARFYRDVLKTPNALFLDGTVSSLWDPEGKRLDSGYPLGPLIVVEKKAKGGGEEGKP
jgi:uncharacterized protein YigE (DUF2233 family)